MFFILLEAFVDIWKYYCIINVKETLLSNEMV